MTQFNTFVFLFCWSRHVVFVLILKRPSFKTMECALYCSVVKIIIIDDDERSLILFKGGAVLQLLFLLISPSQPHLAKKRIWSPSNGVIPFGSRNYRPNTDHKANQPTHATMMVASLMMVLAVVQRASERMCWYTDRIFYEVASFSIRL